MFEVLKRSYKKYYFSARDPLKEEEIFSNYYSDSGFDKQVVFALWKEIADIFKIPPGKLRPTDTFGVELGGFYAFVNPEIDELDSHVMTYLKHHPQAISASIKTLDDYIRIFHDPAIDAGRSV